MSANFFRKIPRVSYKFKLKETIETHDLVNTTIKYRLSMDTVNSLGQFYKFKWRDGLRPDVVAERYYGNNEMYWLVLFSAGVYDIHSELPMRDETLMQYLFLKYKDAPDFRQYVNYVGGVPTNDDILLYTNRKIKEYRDKDGDVVDPLHNIDAVPVSILQYELEENERKREINLIDDRYSIKMRTEYSKAMSDLIAEIGEQ